MVGACKPPRKALRATSLPGAHGVLHLRRQNDAPLAPSSRLEKE
ncbi:Hypothetical protein CAP_4062 [Chondromyces apiculatus DSM 436]|uniref:Uncharacterized protein n=1 Tax=Chondromyces apiculatus DSM 436 TaxID=1192034 RepID=A0A017TI47_9BACT|nr:Hypothetical protein CAP_4062 [Chondromyces apiculatus DSM 436]